MTVTNNKRSISITILAWLYIVFGAFSVISGIGSLIMYSSLEGSYSQISGNVSQFNLFGIDNYMKVQIIASIIMWSFVLIASILVLMRMNIGRYLLIFCNATGIPVLIYQIYNLLSNLYSEPAFVNTDRTFNSFNLIGVFAGLLGIAFYTFVILFLKKKRAEFR